MPTLYRIDCEHAAHDEPGFTVYYYSPEQAAAMLAAQTRRGYYCDLYPVLVPDRLACELTLGVFRNAACDEPAAQGDSMKGVCPRLLDSSSARCVAWRSPAAIAATAAAGEFFVFLTSSLGA